MDPLDRLTWIGLWCCADRSGRLEDRPAKLRVQVLPYDEGDFSARLERLAGVGRIIRYDGPDGRPYIQIVNWDEHQKPHHTEPESTIPPYEVRECVSQPSNNGVLTVSERAGREGKGREKEGKGREGKGVDATSSPSADADMLDAVASSDLSFDVDQTRQLEYREFERVVVDTWNTLPCPPFVAVSKLTDDRRKHLRARFGENAFRDNIAAIVERIRGSTFLRGSNDRAWVASFDWLVKNEQNYTKTLEGKYDDRKTAHTNGASRNGAPQAGTNARDRNITRSIPDFARSRLLAIDDLDARVDEAYRLGIIPDRATDDEVRRLA